MSPLFDSFWRAALWCFRPRVIVMSLLPLLLIMVLTLAMAWFFWDAALQQVSQWLDAWSLNAPLWHWLESVGAGNLKTVLVPLLVVFAATPVIVLTSLIVVSEWVAPALVKMVAKDRFPRLQARYQARVFESLWWAAKSTLVAVVVLLASIPLWTIPPLGVVLPALIWGWLGYRTMAFAALAEHATKEERRSVLRLHRKYLLGIALVTGLMGSLPAMVWAGAGVLFVAFFVVLVPLAIWVYMLVFVFSSLWYAHYCLGALQQFRYDNNSADRPGLPIQEERV